MSALDTVAPMLARPWVHGHEFRRGIEAFAHHACKALGLQPVSVKWMDITTAAINNSGEMFLANCRDDERIGRARVARLAAYVVHELLHRRYTDFRMRDSRPYVQALHNACEDAWIERRAIREELLGNIGPLLKALITDMATEARLEVADWSDPRQYPFAFAVFARGYGPTVPVPAAILPVFKQAAARIDACTCSADTLEVARWLFDQLQQDQQPQQPEDQGQDQGQDGEQGDGQAGDQDGGQEGQETAQDAPQDGGQGVDQGEGEKTAQSPGQGESQGDPADAGEAKRPRHSEDAREVEPSPGESTGGGGSYTREAGTAADVPQYKRDMWPASVAVPGRLRYEVRRLFENSAREWRDPGFKSGTLHRGSLHRVALDRPEVFARRFSEDGVDSAVAILLDISGSMFSAMSSDSEEVRAASRIGAAVGACGMLLDCLAQAGAETMVITFGDSTHVLKPFGKPWRQTLQALRRIGPTGNTNDWHALRIAHDALLQHPAQRRVVFAITDGDGNRHRTAKQRESGEALGIQHFGIGIQHDIEHTWGANSVRINRATDLGRVALQQLRKAA